MKDTGDLNEILLKTVEKSETLWEPTCNLMRLLQE